MTSTISKTYMVSFYLRREGNRVIGKVGKTRTITVPAKSALATENEQAAVLTVPGISGVSNRVGGNCEDSIYWLESALPVAQTGAYALVTEAEERD